MTTDYSRVSFDLDSMRMTSITFTHKFAVLKTYRVSGVSSPQRLRVIKSMLHLDDRYAQSLRRWWDGDSREELCSYMRAELNDYGLFLNMITMALNHDRFNTDLISVRDRCLTLCEAICPALQALTQLYPDYEMFTSCMESAQNALNQFILRHSGEGFVPLTSISELIGKTKKV